MAYYQATVSPEYDKLIEQFRDWCKAAHGRQQKIADALRVSKQLVSGWLSGYRAISLDEWTEIQAIINEESAGTQFPEDNKTMSIHVDPPKLPANARDHNNEPKTLFQAKEQLEILRLENARLKAAAVASSAKPRPTPPASSTAMIVNPGKPLSEMTAIERLRSQLNTAAPSERDAIYRQIKQLEGDVSLAAYREAHRK